MAEVDWGQVTVLGSITVTLIGLFSWVLKRVLNWVMMVVNLEIGKMREDVHAMTQSYQKSNEDFITYLKEEARFRNKTWYEITNAVRDLTDEIRRNRHDTT